MRRRNIVRNSTGNGLPCTGETIRLDICYDFLCPDVLDAIAVPLLLALLILVILGIAFYSLYNLIETLTFAYYF